VFFANWNIAHPEEEEGNAVPTANAAAAATGSNHYGSMP
jgi:hypothetical protein